AESPAELISLQTFFFDRIRVLRIEFVIPNKLETGAVKLIRAGLRDKIDDGICMLAVTRLYRARLRFELLYCIGKWNGQVQVVAGIIMATAIHRKIRAAGRTAGDGNGGDRILPV